MIILPEPLPPPIPVPVGWEGILLPEERILWQGRPDTRLRISTFDLAQFGFGAIFLTLGLAFVALGVRFGPPQAVIGGVLSALSGMGIMFGGSTLQRLRLRRQHYTLTNQRAIVGRHSLLGEPRLEHLSLDPPTVLRVENQGQLCNLTFHRAAGPGNGLGQDQALRFLSLTQGAKRNLMKQHPREAP